MAKAGPLTDRTPEDFILETGRPPRLGDPVPPWHYRGWLLYYLIGLHEQLGWMGRGNRYDYWARCKARRTVPAEPIPQISFARDAQNGRAAEKNLEKCLDIVFHDSGSWSAAGAMLRWLAYGCGFSRQFPELSEKTQEQLYRTYDCKPALLAPYDYLGYMLSEHKGKSRNNTGFFPTPHEVVECMVRMTMGEPGAENWREMLTAKVMDPCIGTGRMMLHASNYSLRLYGMDIDENCVLATKINGALYAPWITWPLDDEIFDLSDVGAITVEAEPVSARELQIAGLIYDPRKRHRDQAILFDVAEK